MIKKSLRAYITSRHFVFFILTNRKVLWLLRFQFLKQHIHRILVIVAFFRELLGSGTLLGFNILNYEPIQNTGYINNGLMLMPPMALIIVACIIWYQRARHKELQEESN